MLFRLERKIKMSGLSLLLIILGVCCLAEGLLPLMSPKSFQRVLAQIIVMKPGQIRFFGAMTSLLGLLLLWAAF